jgi:hypothetical protein
VDLGSSSVKTGEQRSWRYGGPAMVFGLLVNDSATRSAICRGVRENGGAICWFFFFFDFWVEGILGI